MIRVPAAAERNSSGAMADDVIKGASHKEMASEWAELILKLIRKNPGIRPRELHRALGLEHSAHIRRLLTKRGLVRKERRGAAVHYYPVFPQPKR